MNIGKYVKTILNPLNYFSFAEIEGLKDDLAKLYGVTSQTNESIFLTVNGRTAQYIFLKSLNLSRDSNVVIQSFTCNAVVNPILWLGLEPRYVDIDQKNLSLSMDSLKRVVDENTKVIVLQHTFGIPGNIHEVIEFAHSRGILVFEDCAHAIGVTYEGKMLGTFGDGALLSFGIEKILSTRVGGALLLNNKILTESVAREYEQLRFISLFETKKWLLNPLFWLILRRLGGLQKPVVKFLKAFRLLNMGFEECELSGDMPGVYPRKLSNVLAKIVRNEIDELDKNLEHRVTLVRKYSDLLAEKLVSNGFALPGGIGPRVRFPIKCPNSNMRDEILKYLQENEVYVGDWYYPSVYPSRTNVERMRYDPKNCETAEEMSATVLNLPTSVSISESETERISSLILTYISQNGGNETK